ncbi:hypothetical protein DFS34DRAFT_19272 [Phlyctochytrium arcticum]|nr:hypothetical protein DFS34DRAFT_19272 [Phlyctochytrium arcticum]
MQVIDEEIIPASKRLATNSIDSSITEPLRNNIVGGTEHVFPVSPGATHSTYAGFDGEATLPPSAGEGTGVDNTAERSDRSSSQAVSPQPLSQTGARSISIPHQSSATSESPIPAITRSSPTNIAVPRPLATKPSASRIDRPPSASVSRLYGNTVSMVSGAPSHRPAAPTGSINPIIRRPIGSMSARPPTPSHMQKPIARTLPNGIPGTTFIQGQPPHMAASLQARIPRPMRQKALDKFFREFDRIYAPILGQAPALAHEHALKEEAALLMRATQHNYMMLATQTLIKLKRRPLATGVNDVGIESEWRPAESAQSAESTQNADSTQNAESKG